MRGQGAFGRPVFRRLSLGAVALQTVGDLLEGAVLAGRKLPGRRLGSMLREPDHLVGETPVGLRDDGKRRYLALERIGFRVVDIRFAGCRHGLAAGWRQKQAELLRIDDRVRHARDAEAPKPFERAVAAIDRERCEIHRDFQIGSLDRPEHRPAGPGIAPGEQSGDLAGRVETEGERHIDEFAADDICGVRSHRVDEFRRK